MCGTANDANNACCPSSQIFQERICGNFQGPLTGDAAIVWQAPATNNDYIQGTFEIFVENGDVAATVASPLGAVTFPAVTAGNSLTRSVNSPTSFTLTGVVAGENGRFCITLYKRKSL
ncbi:S-Ena type endospore appendage [Bacillus sp. JJ722]|uniref:S-Ena type endospore appendage n=1 Tax=Bacillus sp. JJ722 TaxID=3122973 RepID=UPI002FFE2160